MSSNDGSSFSRRKLVAGLGASALLQIYGGATIEKWRNFGGKYPLGRAGQP